MSFIPTKSGFDIFDPLDGGGNARGPNMGEMQTWTTEVEDYLNTIVSFNADQSTIAGNTTIGDSHHGKTLRVNGAGIIVTVPADTSLTKDNHVTWITNPQLTTAVKIKSSGAEFSDFWLWPRQTCRIFKDGSIMIAERQPLWRPDGQATFYAAASGIDDTNNDGLSASRPISIQEAINRVEFYVQHDGVGSKIKLAAGTYTENNIAHTFRVTGYHVIYIEGADTADPTQSIIQVASGQVGFTARDYSALILRAMTFTSSGSASIGISASQTGIIDVWDLWFDEFTGGGYHIESTNGGSVGYVVGSLNNRLAGSATYHWRIAARSSLICSGCTITVMGGLTVTYFALSTLLGSIILSGITFSEGSPNLVGGKYAATLNGVIVGVGFVTLPGSTSGVTATGGQAA